MLIDQKALKEQERSKREIEWQEIEELVIQYQKCFYDQSPETLRKSQQASEELILRFQPLFSKYIRILTKGEINFYDPETRAFVFSFIDKATRSHYPHNKKDIVYKFKFIIKTYGALTSKEILSDITEIFMKLLKRYKQVGRSFCGYLYNAFHHEMSRHVKKFIANPINITYNLDEYKEYVDAYQLIDDFIADYHDKKEVLGLEWINGTECEIFFKDLSVMDRKILMEYYINDQNDKEIGDNFGIDMNTANKRRRKALSKLLKAMPNGDQLKVLRYRKVKTISEIY